MDTIPIYENGLEYPDLVGYFLCHQPQCQGAGCGDLPGIWRLYRIDCNHTGQRVALPPALTLEAAQEQLRAVVQEHSLTLQIKPAPNGDWPTAWYADLQRMYKPVNPPDPATTCTSRHCWRAREAKDNKRVTFQRPPTGGSNVVTPPSVNDRYDRAARQMLREEMAAGRLTAQARDNALLACMAQLDALQEQAEGSTPHV